MCLVVMIPSFDCWIGRPGGDDGSRVRTVTGRDEEGLSPSWALGPLEEPAPKPLRGWVWDWQRPHAIGYWRATCRIETAMQPVPDGSSMACQPLGKA